LEKNDTDILDENNSNKKVFEMVNEKKDIAENVYTLKPTTKSKENVRHVLRYYSLLKIVIEYLHKFVYTFLSV